MITASPYRAQYVAQENSAGARHLRWQQRWREAVTDPRELLDLLGLGHLADSLLPTTDTGFPLRVPRGFIARMARICTGEVCVRKSLPSGK